MGSSGKRTRGPNKQTPWVRKPDDGLSVLRLALDTPDRVDRTIRRRGGCRRPGGVRMRVMVHEQLEPLPRVRAGVFAGQPIEATVEHLTDLCPL